jgi:uncharacterized CHY-type Zn-finger protein
MIIDKKENFDFSDEFHRQAVCNGGVAAVVDNRDTMHWIVAADVAAETFVPYIHAYCGFRCFRDLQTFCAVRGWSLKEIHQLPVVVD